MENILIKIGAGISGIFLFLASLFSATPADEIAILKNKISRLENQLIETRGQLDEETVLGAYNTAGGKKYFLSGGGIAASDTSITLTSFQVPVANFNFRMADFGDVGYLTIEPGNTTRQEFISFTGITNNSDGTATLTGILRGLSPISPYGASTTLQIAHPGGSVVVLSNPPQLYEELATRGNAETIIGRWTFSATSAPQMNVAASTTGNEFVTYNFLNNGWVDATTTESITGIKRFSVLPESTLNATTSDQLTRKSYVDNVALQGAATATQAQAGISRLSVAADAVADPIVVGTNDTRVDQALNWIYEGEAIWNNEVATNTIAVTANRNLYRVVYYASTTASNRLVMRINGGNSDYVTLQVSGDTAFANLVRGFWSFYLASNSTMSVGDYIINNVAASSTSPFGIAGVASTGAANDERMAHGFTNWNSTSTISTLNFSSDTGAAPLTGRVRVYSFSF